VLNGRSNTQKVTYTSGISLSHRNETDDTLPQQYRHVMTGNLLASLLYFSKKVATLDKALKNYVDFQTVVNLL
jgi:hypothetical protein